MFNTDERIVAEEILEHAKGADVITDTDIGEYARDDNGDGFCEVHTNTIEGFWSLLKSWLRPH